MKLSKRNRFRLVWFSLVGTFTLWNWLSYQTRYLPADTLTSTPQTTVVESNQLISFSPSAKKKTVLLFSPGASAYAPTQWVEIKWGNHAQFGYYGSQLGDDNATIIREV